MTVEDIESLVIDCLIQNVEFQEDFCAECEAVTLEEGYRYCPCEFVPSDGGCVRHKAWSGILRLIEKLAGEAAAVKIQGDKNVAYK